MIPQLYHVDLTIHDKSEFKDSIINVHVYCIIFSTKKEIIQCFTN